MSSPLLDQPGPRSWWADREERSGLSGLGDRPSLHPAWREDAPPPAAPPVRLRPQARRLLLAAAPLSRAA